MTVAASAGLVAAVGITPATGVTPTLTSPAVTGQAPAAVTPMKAKPKATLSGSYTVIAGGKIRVAVKSNAVKVTVSYRTARNKNAATTIPIRKGAGSTTLAKGSTRIYAQAKATSKLRASSKIALRKAPPADKTAPGPVTRLRVTATTPTSISLAWANPADKDLAAVIVRRAAGTKAPAKATAGTAVTLKTAKATSVVNTGLTANTSYAYAVFTRDTTGNTRTVGTTIVTRTSAAPRPAAAPIAASGHTCAIVAGGAVKCWGDNQNGALGDGTRTNRLVPVTVKGISGATAIVAGGWNYTCALLGSGEVKCWGTNGLGPLGDGTTSTRLAPVTVKGISDATAIAAGATHTCAIVAGGAVKCWGYNGYGQLGDGTDVDRLTPVLVSEIRDATAISAGNYHTCAILAGGAVKCWGGAGGVLWDGTNTDTWTGSPVSVPVPVVGISGATAIAAGGGHTCAILAGGAVKCWGNNGYGQLGDGTDVDRLTPVTVGISAATAISAGYSHTCAIVAGGAVTCWGALEHQVDDQGIRIFWKSATPVAAGVGGATAIAAGSSHTCAVLAGGAVKCWGSNVLGQLGDGTFTEANRPTPVPVLEVSGATAVTAGFSHTCAVVAEGAVKCWGYNGDGPLGDGTDVTRLTPVFVAGVKDAIATTVFGSGRYSHTCAILAGGEVKCWGSNWSGQLGDGTRTTRLTPVSVVGVSGATAIATGYSHTCAIVAGGEVKCWGNNYHGELGDGTDVDQETPVTVVGVSGATAIVVDSSRTCAIVAGGKIKCWGYNDEMNPIGDGSATAGARRTPVIVAGISGATAIVAEGYNSCALLTGGEVKCWGHNEQGELGDGTTTTRSTPVSAVGISGATAIASSGWGYTCALLTGGDAKCWGNNEYGQLGDGTTTTRSTPVTVAGISGATTIVASDSHACALLTGGDVKCWGNNEYGQLGDGTEVDRLTPVRSREVSGATAIATGSRHTCAILAGGAVKCWGSNEEGRLGVSVVGEPVDVVGIP